MKIVKLSFPYDDWPIFRQTPLGSGIWNDYKFVIDSELAECDYWIIYSDYKLVEERCKCSPDNIIFIPAEGYHTSTKFPRDFLNQFGKIITVQKEIQVENVIHWQNANPWFVEKSYDELLRTEAPQKTKKISVVSSNKVFTEGHKKRLDFVYKLKDYFGDKIDLFGRGIQDFDNKWDVLAPYKFHIAIENDYSENWFTEKLIDPILAYSCPIYYGCPNIDDYFPSNAFPKIDIFNLNESILLIENLLNDQSFYDQFLTKIDDYRMLALNQHQLFPMICSFLNDHPSIITSKSLVTIKGVQSFVSKKNVVYRGFKKISKLWN